MRAFVTGGAGFIGSTLVDRLLVDGHTVIAFDNFSTGQQRFLDQASALSEFTLIRGDRLDAIPLAMTRATAKVNIFNLGTDEFCHLNDSIGWITAQMGISPVLEYTDGDRGWRR